MSVFPRSVWADPFDPPRPERRHDPRAASKRIVVERRVTHAGFVEVTSFV